MDKRCFESGLLRIVMFLFVFVMPLPLAAQAVSPYLYSFWEEPVPAPAALEALGQIDGRREGPAGSLTFSSPEDMVVGPTGDIFVADTGNNRIVRLSSEGVPLAVYESFEDADGWDDWFLSPQGVFITADGAIYVADTGNQRIVVLEPDGSLRAVIGRPLSDLLRLEYQYFPTRLVVDESGRIYVIGPGLFEGIMSFSADGVFQGFVGANRVTIRDAFELFMKRIATRAQRQAMVRFIPEEFSHLDIDDEGFLYSVTANEYAEKPVKRHNAVGLDILKREGFFIPKGDIKITESDEAEFQGRSTLVGISVSGNGFYSVLDSKRRRIFAYDDEGYLLYMAGGPGTVLGSFTDPVAIDTSGDRTLVLDRRTGLITVFRPTEYGRLIRDAIAYHRKGDYRMSSILWSRVLELNGNHELAYTGIGKALLRERRAREAMDYFKEGNNRPYWSKAFKIHRREQARIWFGPFMTILVLGMALVLVRSAWLSRHPQPVVRRFMKSRPSIPAQLVWAPRLIGRPFDGFHDLKHLPIGTIGGALAMCTLLFASILFDRQLTAFLFNTVDPSRFNILQEFLSIAVPILLFCLANWSVTSIMDGEGTFAQIFIAFAFAMVPLVLSLVPTSILSHGLSLDEAAFFHALRVVAMLLTAFLVISGSMTIHNYSMGKTLWTLLATIVAMGIIVFLGLLFVVFIEQVWSFVATIWRELSYRM
jgi:hypothetical protein